MHVWVMGIVCGAIVAVIAVPVLFQLLWLTKDFTRKEDRLPPPDAEGGRPAWTNWSELETATPQLHAKIDSTGQLARSIKDAPAPIRPHASGHSFTPLCASQGTMVDVSALTGLLSHNLEEGSASLGAGTPLREASRLMHEQGLAFANLGDIDVQTLAGAFSTGTHGTGYNLAALHDHISGFELVTQAGEIMQINARTNAEIFQAGKVSLGALGVITRYDLAVVPSYNLHRRVTLAKTGDMLDNYMELSRSHRNFEALFFPGTGHCAALVHNVHEGEIGVEKAVEEDDFLSDLRKLRNFLGWWPLLRRKAFEAVVDPDTSEEASDASWKLLATVRPTKFNEMEYHIPIENGIDTLRKVLAKMESRKDAFFPIEARVTAGDEAWLSPFNDGRRMSIAIHAQADEDYQFFFTQFEPIFLKAGGRPHWGKLHSLTAKELAALYPRFNDFNAIRQELDPDGRMLTPYMKRLLARD